jgi:hypothetical protein
MATQMAVAAPIAWTDWTSGAAGLSGSASGTLDIGGTIVDVNYSGEIEFSQTAGGINYWNPATPYISASVDNAPPGSDIIALSKMGSKTLTFSHSIDNLFFAVVSLNRNGYQFNRDFEIISSDCGYWGCGNFTKVDMGNGNFQLISTGGMSVRTETEPHGVIRFAGGVSELTWTTLRNERWNGFTVGGTGSIGSPEPASFVLMLIGLGLVPVVSRRLRR